MWGHIIPLVLPSVGTRVSPETWPLGIDVPESNAGSSHSVVCPNRSEVTLINADANLLNESALNLPADGDSLKTFQLVGPAIVANRSTLLLLAIEPWLLLLIASRLLHSNLLLRTRHKELSTFTSE